jgi:hypothetical protein
MMADSVVWILGSGFSKPLGAPLLYDLFSQPLEVRMRAALRNMNGGRADMESFAKQLKTLRAIYAGGLEERRTNTQFKKGPWANAEEFLEYVDMANEGDSSAREIVQQAVGEADVDYYEGHAAEDQCKYLARDVRAYLAAACHFFVPDQSLIQRSERWRPYVRWGKHLQKDDHVITFNYDVVPESVSGVNPFIRGSVPSDGSTWLEHSILLGRQLVKMHGSVTRAEVVCETPSGPQTKIDTVDVWSSIADGNRFEIASPGPGKLLASTDYFTQHWSMARKLIQRASAVIFVGYRIPETDSFACEELVRAFSEHPQRSELVVRIVLGPHRSADVERLIRILHWAGCSKKCVIHEPLYSQDFLSVFQRQALTSCNYSGLGE